MITYYDKAVIIGSSGFLGNLTIVVPFIAIGLNFPIARKEVRETAKFGKDVDKLTIATLFMYSCRAELSIAGEKVMGLGAKYGAIETKAIDLKEIPTEGKNLDIELRCEHIIRSGFKYAACATVVGVKEY